MITRVTQNSEKDGVGCTVETSSSHKLMVWHLSGSSWILDHFDGIEFGRGSTSCRHLNRIQIFMALQNNLHNTSRSWFCMGPVENKLPIDFIFSTTRSTTEKCTVTNMFHKWDFKRWHRNYGVLVYERFTITISQYDWIKQKQQVIKHML